MGNPNQLGTSLASNNTWVSDLTAGFCVAGLLLPEAVAYSGLAHLSVTHALTGLLVGLFIYGFFGKSRFAIVSPTSSTATMAAAAAIAMPVSMGSTASTGYFSAFFALVLVSGIVLFLLAIAKQGQLSSFVSRPVLRGFAFGLAVTIVIKQLPDAFGISIPKGYSTDPFHIFAYVFEHIAQWNLTTTLIALLAGLGVVLFKRWPKLPASMIVIVLAIAAAQLFNLKAYGVEEVGEIIRPDFQLVWPNLTKNEWLQVTELAFGLLVLVFAESWGSIRTMALQHGDSVEPNRELLVLGVCNISSALFQGMPVGAGFSGTSANAAAGAVSRKSGLIAGITIVFALLYALPYIHALPRAVLAVAVISALWHALSIKPLLAIWHMNRDRYLVIIAAAAVLMFGVLHGMLAAIGFSIVAALRRFSEPVVHELGRLGTSHNFISLDMQPDALTTPDLLILRPEEPLFFACAERVTTEVIKRLDKKPSTQTIILSLEESADVDSTALECLEELRHRLQYRKVKLVLARVKNEVRSLMQYCDPNGLGDSANIFWSVDDAVQAQQVIK